MKKIFAIVVVTCIALSFISCANNDEKTKSATVSTNVSITKPTMKEEATQSTNAIERAMPNITTTKEETTQSTNPFDYIKKPSDLLDDLKPLSLKQGCDIDTYTDYSNTDFDIRLLGNSEGQYVMIHNSSYYTEDSDIIGFGPTAYLLITNNTLLVKGTNELFVGEIFDTVLKDCPHEYKYLSRQMSFLFDDYSVNVDNGKRATWTINNYEFAVSKGYNSNGVIDGVVYSLNW